MRRGVSVKGVPYDFVFQAMLLPMNMGSHILFFSRVANALVDQGHQADLYVPSNNKPPLGLSDKVKVIHYKVCFCCIKLVNNCYCLNYRKKSVRNSKGKE